LLMCSVLKRLKKLKISEIIPIQPVILINPVFC
jgi:hypothetical protein